MPRARQNPLGLPLPPKTEVVKAGAYGEHTHIWHPHKHVPICKSGFGRAKGNQSYSPSDAKFVTCYRCAKLGNMNLAAGRQVWEGPEE